jgi:hypothetical protein
MKTKTILWTATALVLIDAIYSIIIGSIIGVTSGRFTSNIPDTIQYLAMVFLVTGSFAPFLLALALHLKSKIKSISTPWTALVFTYFLYIVGYNLPWYLFYAEPALGSHWFHRVFNQFYLGSLNGLISIIAIIFLLTSIRGSRNSDTTNVVIAKTAAKAIGVIALLGIGLAAAGFLLLTYACLVGHDCL